MEVLMMLDFCSGEIHLWLALEKFQRIARKKSDKKAHYAPLLRDASLQWPRAIPSDNLIPDMFAFISWMQVFSQQKINSNILKMHLQTIQLQSSASTFKKSAFIFRRHVYAYMPAFKNARKT